MLRNFVLAAGALTIAAGFGAAGFAMAQEVQQTTTSSQAVTTAPAAPNNAPDINAQAADAQAKARAQAKPGEEYQWSVDSTTTRVPVHPTVIEKTTTTNVAPPPAVEHRHTQETTTTTQGGE